ncbi:MAG: phosphohistidine phosphatase SixA [Nitrospinae bacterium]|nr:phosphohistidine phosphatase SixA [Nitrospinota bacterium]
MELYLARHGSAEDAAPDAERVLTKRGVEETEAMARWLRKLRLNLDFIWHSGKTRALQTAVIFHEKLEPKPKISQVEGLKPDDDPKAILEKLKTTVAKRGMIVGHLPHLGKLAALLLSGNAGGTVVELEKSAVLCLSNDSGNWAVRWLIHPKIAPDA